MVETLVQRPVQRLDTGPLRLPPDVDGRAGGEGAGGERAGGKVVPVAGGAAGGGAAGEGGPW